MTRIDKIEGLAEIWDNDQIWQRNLNWSIGNPKDKDFQVLAHQMVMTEMLLSTLYSINLKTIVYHKST